jgi:hypothetical protein
MSFVELEAKPGFVHRSDEPRYFVLRLDARDRGYAAGFRLEVQLLNHAGQGEAVLRLTEPIPGYRTETAYVPAEVIAAAARQPKGQGEMWTRKEQAARRSDCCFLGRRPSG